MAFAAQCPVGPRPLLRSVEHNQSLWAGRRGRLFAGTHKLKNAFQRLGIPLHARGTFAAEELPLHLHSRALCQRPSELGEPCGSPHAQIRPPEWWLILARPCAQLFLAFSASTVQDLGNFQDFGNFVKVWINLVGQIVKLPPGLAKVW